MARPLFLFACMHFFCNQQIRGPFIIHIYINYTKSFLMIKTPVTSLEKCNPIMMLRYTLCYPNIFNATLIICQMGRTGKKWRLLYDNHLHKHTEGILNPGFFFQQSRLSADFFSTNKNSVLFLASPFI